MARIQRPLTGPQRRAARLLAGGVSGKQTAEQVGVRPETVSRWKVDPAFQEEIDHCLDEIAQGDPKRRAVSLVPQALDVLVVGMKHPEGATRIRAAAAILQFVSGDMSSVNTEPDNHKTT